MQGQNPEARRYRQELARQCGRIPSGCLCSHISRQDRPEGSWKKALVSWLDSFTGGGIRPPKVPYPARLAETVDWANKKRRTWTHPFKGDEKHRESVDEILARASFEAANHINGLFAAILRGEPIGGFFPNISYNTGLPCEE